MPCKPFQKMCKNCQNEFTSIDKRRMFCGRSCAQMWNNSHRPPMSEQQKKKISDSTKRWIMEHPEKLSRGEKHAKIVAKTTIKKYRAQMPTSILELSHRTVLKIIRRLNIACSRCGWNEGTCDIHHINGRKISDPHNHDNLTIICPNCHRLCGEKKINKLDLITFSQYIGDRWKEYYYG